MHCRGAEEDPEGGRTNSSMRWAKSDAMRRLRRGDVEESEEAEAG
ncbi:hypothetical protein ABE196_18780 [Bacillus subtilis]